jgi:hypothetical protein
MKGPQMEQIGEPTTKTPKLFDKSHMKSYVLVLCGLLGISGIYYLLFGMRQGMPGTSGGAPPMGGTPPNGFPPSGSPPPSLGSDGLNPMGGGQPNGFGADLWPLWGSLNQVSVNALLLGIGIFGLFLVLAALIFKKLPKSIRLPIFILTGMGLILCTNLLYGWEIGVVNPIGNFSEIYTDALNIQNVLEFISNFNAIQASLTIHAQTQPPGAVLVIYLLNEVFGTPSGVALGLAAVATIGSSCFLYGIFKRWYDREDTDYAVFLFLLLPAIQVYYLANIYAIVATLIIGTVYFYFHPNRALRISGTLVCVGLATFISFLSVVVLLCFGLYELFGLVHARMLSRTTLKENGIKKSLLLVIQPYYTLIATCGAIVLGYLLLWKLSGFNYLEAFTFASALENPNGFMLFTDPGQYFITRLQDIMDILVFFEPILIVLCYRGFQSMRKSITDQPDGINQEMTRQKYFLFLAALIALGIMFLTGAPKKGETARICMFILPFLLITVMDYLQRNRFSGMEKFLLLAVVFAQTIVMQLIMNYIW